MNVSGVSVMKKNKGRQKIPIKKIEETTSRQVTFSKRRNGLFKKASELCILTGAQMAILVESPGGRCYAFGHPSPDAIIDRYMNNNNTEDNKDNSTINTSTSPKQPQLAELNHQYNEASKELEFEKRKNELIQQEKIGNSSELPWYEQDTEGMEVEELEQFLAALVELKRKVSVRADDLANARITASLGPTYSYEKNNTIAKMNIVLDNFGVGNNLENTRMIDPTMGLEGLGSDLDNFYLWNHLLDNLI